MQQTLKPADQQPEVKEGMGGPEAQQQPVEAPAENAEQVGTEYRSMGMDWAEEYFQPRRRRACACVIK